MLFTVIFAGLGLAFLGLACDELGAPRLIRFPRRRPQGGNGPRQ
jgi:hypothetical protein